MVDEMIKKLLESGVHFGHQTRRWNPKMKRFIFGERSGIYIIDLEKTVENLNRARDFAQEVASKGGTVLFVGTKKQAQEVVESEAKRCGMYFINNRWMGGLLTNFETVKKSIERLNHIERMQADGVFENLTKKEIARLTKEKEKLLHDLGGIREMKNIPKAIFIVDTKKEEIAVKEAKKLGIPIIGLIDTNCDPDPVDFPVPGNDDALKSIRYITSLIADNVLEGRKSFLEVETVKREAASKETASKHASQTKAKESSADAVSSEESAEKIEQ